MPFGLNGAPATFQRLMNTVLSGCEQFLAAYLDDIVVFTASWDEHLKSLQTLFDRLQSAGLTAWPSKCQLGRCSAKYLGHIISNVTVQPDPDKLAAVASFPQPRTKKEVRSFLGLPGYYRRFIPAFSSLPKPLSDLTKKDASATPQWDTSCQAAFDRLKSLLCSKPVLMSSDFDQPFVLETDASGIGIGAVLSQDDADSHRHPNAYYLWKLLPRETRYSVVEKEALAVRDATCHFRVYLLGREILVITDHRALEWLQACKDSNPRLIRWSLHLQCFKFTVRHRPGRLNGNADALSKFLA